MLFGQVDGVRAALRFDGKIALILKLGNVAILVVAEDGECERLVALSLAASIVDTHLRYACLCAMRSAERAFKIPPFGYFPLCSTRTAFCFHRRTDIAAHLKCLVDRLHISHTGTIKRTLTRLHRKLARIKLLTPDIAHATYAFLRRVDLAATFFGFKLPVFIWRHCTLEVCPDGDITLFVIEVSSTVRPRLSGKLTLTVHLGCARIVL